MKTRGNGEAKPFLLAHAWTHSRLGEALEALAHQCGLPMRDHELSIREPEEADVSAWIDRVSLWVGFEVESISVRYPDLTRLLRKGGPMLLKLPGSEGGFLAIVGGRGARVRVLDEYREMRWIHLEEIRSVLCSHLESPLIDEINQILQQAEVPASHQFKARKAILAERLNNVSLADCWLLRMPPDSSFAKLLRRQSLVSKLVLLTFSYVTLYLLWILSWALVGRSAFAGHFDRGWFFAWALALITIIPFRCLTYWSQASIAVRLARLIKQRMISGALRLDRDEVRRQGTGQLMGRVIESEAVESLAMSGGFLTLFACLELVLGVWILWASRRGIIVVLLLISWCLITFLIGLYYYRQRMRWAATRLDLTDDLIERMVGYRTRIAQEPGERWHDGEDTSLNRYFALSKVMDRWSVILALVPRSWLVIGVLGLAASFVYQQQTSVALAIMLGGILFCYRAFGRIVLGATHLADAAIAWKNVSPVFLPARQSDPVGLPSFRLAQIWGSSAVDRKQIIELKDVGFHYAAREERLLRNISLRIVVGDRLLLEGPSGSGKSTLVSILTGMRRPDTGLVLIHGFDRETLGAAGWTKKVVAASQFNENYVFTETFAFNLLMGRRWPPRPEDLREAIAICEELGLASLLKRMPAGIWQTVGETGWRLSHGERSRLYIARALLQSSDFVIFDESFASLDPQTLLLSFRCVLQRAATLLVVAHP